MKTELRVSICIPVYNGERFIKETLDSIVAQDYKNKEIVISDNASTDKTPEIIQGYVKKYGIKCYRNEQHLPIGEYNFNRCISLAKGDLVCVYHADDVYKPNIVSKCVELFERYNNIGAVWTMANIINQKGETTGRYCLPKELRKLGKDFYSFDEIFSCILKYQNSFLVCPSVMVRKKVYDEVGGWDYERYKSAADLGLWLKIAQKYDIGIINCPLVNYRLSKTQGFSETVKNRVWRVHYLSVMDNYADKIRGHRFEKYYAVHKISDLTLRALNLSANPQIEESNRLIKESLNLYLKSFFRIAVIPKAIECLFIIIALSLLNRFSCSAIRVSFRDFVFKTNDNKKRFLFNFLEKGRK